MIRKKIKKLVKWAFIFVAAIYVVFPLDLLPEVLLGPLGLIDDFVVTLIGGYVALQDLGFIGD